MDSPTRSDTSVDQDLSNIVDTITSAGKPTTPSQPSVDATVDYVLAEVNSLKRKQVMIQEQMETKTKEMQGLRETLLVMSGAVQGLQHIHQFMTKKEEVTEPFCASAQLLCPRKSASSSSSSSSSSSAAAAAAPDAAASTPI
jgi:hypothetical protein